MQQLVVGSRTALPPSCLLSCACALQEGHNANYEEGSSIHKGKDAVTRKGRNRKTGSRVILKLYHNTEAVSGRRLCWAVLTACKSADHAIIKRHELNGS